MYTQWRQNRVSNYPPVVIAMPLVLDSSEVGEGATQAAGKKNKKRKLEATQKEDDGAEVEKLIERLRLEN